jgi:uncharacterized integral membrane protein
MTSIINQAGYAVTVLDFAPDTYSFPMGLVMLTAFSAALIIIEAVRYHYSQKTAAGIDTVLTEVEYRKAA